jgi:hypothetical protein
MKFVRVSPIATIDVFTLWKLWRYNSKSRNRSRILAQRRIIEYPKLPTRNCITDCPYGYRLGVSHHVSVCRVKHLKPKT